MTTNSPNSVDGDVQALIADCQAEIAEIEKVLAIDEYAAISHLQSKLKRQKVALAALTAKPIIWNTGFIQNATDADFNHERTENHDVPLYTTPPAQLLRPVELPPKSDVKMGGDAKTRALLTGMNMMLKSCTEALRQQGYEVKND